LIMVKEAQITMKFVFMQINQDKLKSSGSNILETFGTKGTAQWTEGGMLEGSLAAGANITINSIVGKAYADTLHTTNLYTTSGQETDFKDGALLIIKGAEGAGSTSVQTGLVIKVLPVYYSNGDIHLKVKVEVSSPSKTAEGLISINKFETSTYVVCPQGKTLLLTKLLSSVKTRFQEHTPLLGQFPIIKNFFSKDNKTQSHKDLVVLISPQVTNYAKDLISAEYRFLSLREMLTQGD
jgi:Flp pilus assembly secretin CpaC